MKKLLIILIISSKIHCINSPIKKTIQAIKFNQEKINNTMAEYLKKSFRIHVKNLKKKLKDDLEKKISDIKLLIQEVKQKLDEYNEIIIRKYRRRKKKKIELLKKYHSDFNHYKKRITEEIEILKDKDIQEIFPSNIFNEAKKLLDYLS